MDPEFVQNLRYKLQKRVRRLNSVDWQMFIPALRQFWRFFDANAVYSGIAELLMAGFPELSNDVNRILAGANLVGDTEEEAAAIGYAVLRHLCEFDVIDPVYAIARNFGPASKPYEAVDTVREVFLEPLYEYVDEHLDDQRAMLALLLRYKHRSEWFHRDHLGTIVGREPEKGEWLLAIDLYSYLHDQGIDFTIQPSSITGEIDLIAAQGSEDPLLADAKIFDGDKRGKAYIRKAFNQIYTYTQQYNEPFGYLVIFKTTDRDLHFALSTASRNTPVVVYNHKTIFLLTIDIFTHAKPVSQRDPLKVVEITEEDLVETIEDTSQGPV
jgi:hypothetical protein